MVGRDARRRGRVVGRRRVEERRREVGCGMVRAAGYRRMEKGSECGR